MKGARTGKGAGVSTLTPLLSSREWSLRKHLWGGPWLPREGVIKGVKGEKLQGREGHGMQSGASRSLSCKGGGVGGGWDWLKEGERIRLGTFMHHPWVARWGLTWEAGAGGRGPRGKNWDNCSSINNKKIVF